MPPDLSIAIASMSGVSILIFFAVAKILPKVKGKWTNLAAFGGVGGLVVHAIYLNDNISIARVLPLANVVVWGNLSPIFVALLAGVAWIKMPGAKWQRMLACAALYTICLHQAYWHLLGAPPALRPDRWSNGVCRQSTTSTCSAAAAATLLAGKGISTTEAEMAQLCLTRERGTTSFGIYRGLKLKSGRRVEIFDISLEKLLSLNEPAMISIGLSNNDPGGIGLPIGNSHSIVLFGVKPDGMIDIGDPFAGRQAWTKEQLKKVWQGEGLVVR